MNRPRESILNLFDPLNLNHPSTPKRISESPDLDKENEPGETTSFFNRTYSRQTVLVPVQEKPMKRLVDVGDATAVLDEDGMGGLLSVVIEEDEGEMWEEERKATLLNDHKVESTPRQEGLGPMSLDDAQTPMQRAPFTDITSEATPIARKKTYRRDGITAVNVSAPQTSPRTTRAPPGSPLASIINAVNFSNNTNTRNAAKEHEFEDEQDQIPRMSVSSTSDSTLASSTAGLIPSSSAALLTQTNDPPHVLESNPNLSASTNTLTGSTAHLVPSTTSALLTNIPLSHLPLAASISKSDYEPSSPPPPLPPSYSASPPKSAYKHSRRGSLIPSPKKSNKLTDTAGLRASHTHQNSIDMDLQSSFNFIHLQHPEISFDLLNDRISFSGLDNSLNVRMDASVAASGMNIGMESSFVGRASGCGVDMSIMGDFDVKDEEGRMKVFLGTSADWEGKIEAEGTNMTREIPSPVRIVKTAAASKHNTPQPKPKANAKYLPQTTPGSAERTPKPPMKTAATIPKKRLSFSLSSTSGFTGAGTPRRVSAINSPSKGQNNRSTNTNTPRRLSIVNSPSKLQNSGFTNTNTPKAVSSPSKTQGSDVKRTAPRRSIVPTLTPRSQKGACAPPKVAYVAPPPVPALRIVKRSFVNASAKTQPPDRAASVTGSSTSTSAAAGARPRPSILAARLPSSSMPAQSKLAHKPALQGVQRPRPSIAATVAGPPKTTFGVPSKMVKPSKQLSAGSGAAGASKSKLGRPASIVSSSTTTKAVASVPSRLPTAPLASSTGLRPPSRFGYSTSSTGGGSSALPKPISSVAGPAVSRLPTAGSARITSKIGSVGSATGGSKAGGRRV